MRFVNLFACLTIGVALAAPAVHAQSGNKPEKAVKERAAEMREEKRERAERSLDEAEARAERQREELEKRSGRSEDDDSDSEDHDSDSADADSDSEDHYSDSEDSDSEDGAGNDKQLRDAKDRSEARGNERAQEMRARRDERKEIMQEYKEGRGAEDGVVDVDPDAEEAADEQQAKGKKPWWKFWGD